MELACIPLPVAAVSYQKLILLTVTQLAEVTIVKITVCPFCGADYFCYNEISLQRRQLKLINELRCFHKHLHSSEISDKLHVHCDVKHKNSLSCPAIAI